MQINQQSKPALELAETRGGAALGATFCRGSGGRCVQFKQRLRQFHNVFAQLVFRGRVDQGQALVVGMGYGGSAIRQLQFQRDIQAFRHALNPRFRGKIGKARRAVQGETQFFMGQTLGL